MDDYIGTLFTYIFPLLFQGNGITGTSHQEMEKHYLEHATQPMVGSALRCPFLSSWGCAARLPCPSMVLWSEQLRDAARGSLGVWVS